MSQSEVVNNLNQSRQSLHDDVPQLETTITYISDAQQRILDQDVQEQGATIVAIRRLGEALPILSELRQQVPLYDDRLQSYLRQIGGVPRNLESVSPMADRHPDWPTIKNKFHFSPHGNALDGSALPEQMRDADIVLYESLTQDPGVKQAFQQISDGTLPLSLEEIIEKMKIGGKPIKGSFTEAFIRGIHGTHKIIESIDIDSKNPDEAEIAEGARATWTLPEGASFEEALASIEAQLTKIAHSQNSREAIAAERYEKRLQEIIEKHPELKTRAGVTVSIPIGTYHTGLEAKIHEKTGVASERTFSAGAPLLGFEDSVQQSAAAGNKISADEAAKVLLERIVRGAVNANLEDPSKCSTDDLLVYLAKVGRAIDIKSIQQIYEISQKGMLSKELISAILISQGLSRLPKTLEELKRASKTDS